MNKIKTTHRDTHSRPESLSIIDPMTKEQIQDFIDRDYSWTTIPKDITIDKEPDWTPTL